MSVLIFTQDDAARLLGMESSALFVDRRESAENDAGAVLLPLQKHVVSRDDVRAELGEALEGHAAGRPSDGDLTVFNSLGLAIEDLAAAECGERCGREGGGGTEVVL